MIRGSKSSIALEPPAPTASPELVVLLEEYRALRAEVAVTLQAQHAVLSYGVAALALFGLAIGNAWDEAPTFSALALMGGVPIGGAFIVFLWSAEFIRMKRSEAFVGGYLERRINSMLAQNVGSEDENPHPYLQWEQWLAGDVEPRRESAAKRSERFRASRVRSAFAATMSRASRHLMPHRGANKTARERAKRRSLGWGFKFTIVSLAFLAVASYWVGVVRFDERARIARHCAAAHKADDPLCPGYQPRTTPASGATLEFRSTRLSVLVQVASPETVPNVERSRAAIYFRNWRMTLLHPDGWEFFLTLLLFQVLPFGFGAVMWRQYLRKYQSDELPRVDQ